MDTKPIILAICYDFDKTLTPDDMQAQGYIQSVGFDKDRFWAESNSMAKENDMDQNLSYMLKMKNESEGKFVFTRQNLQEYGAKIKYFPGVKEWFKRTKGYGDKYGVKIEHYVISSGLKEMIEGTILSQNGCFERIYASSFYYNDRGVAVWPAQVVNYTNKTQFIFRISKGYLDINDERVNDYVKPENLRVPFRNMVYIGDSDTDVPCMKLVNANGGYSIGVFNSDLGENAKQRVHKMFLEKRIGYFCPADYTAKSPLDILLKDIIRLTAIRSQIEQIHLDCEKDTRLRKRDCDLAKAVDTLVRVRRSASTDWNGLMSNPEILINAIGASDDLQDGLFYRAIMEQAQRYKPAIEKSGCSDDER